MTTQPYPQPPSDQYSEPLDIDGDALAHFEELHFWAKEVDRLSDTALDEGARSADVAARNAAKQAGTPATSVGWPATDLLMQEREEALKLFNTCLTVTGQFALAWIGCAELHHV